MVVLSKLTSSFKYVGVATAKTVSRTSSAISSAATSAFKSVGVATAKTVFRTSSAISSTATSAANLWIPMYARWSPELMFLAGLGFSGWIAYYSFVDGRRIEALHRDWGILMLASAYLTLDEINPCAAYAVLQNIDDPSIRDKLKKMKREMVREVVIDGVTIAGPLVLQILYGDDLLSEHDQPERSQS